MKTLTCKHCGHAITIEDTHCPKCGIPLPPNQGNHPQRRFILWFIALVIFCAVMIFWLPPDWSRFLEK
jgi:hypothetical protein